MADISNVTILSTIKNWFKTGSIPTQTQFWAVFDSFWHKSESIPTSSVKDLDQLLDGKADSEALDSHTEDTNAHKNLFDAKVDVVDGKELSSNDYVDGDKEKLDAISVIKFIADTDDNIIEATKIDDKITFIGATVSPDKNEIIIGNPFKDVTVTIGDGLIGTITTIGDNLKGKVVIDLTAVDDEILEPLSVIELCSIDFGEDEVKLPFALLSPATPISNFYIETNLSGVKALTTDYDKKTQKLLGIENFPATIAFYYNIIY